MMVLFKIAAIERVYEPGRMNIQTQLDKLSNVIEAKLTQNIAHIFQQEVSYPFATRCKNILLLLLLSHVLIMFILLHRKFGNLLQIISRR